MDTQLILAIVAGAAAAAGAIISLLQPRITGIRFAGLELELRPGKPTTDPQEQTRLIEAREELKRQQSTATWTSRAAGFLTLNRYLVGAVLATSFVQQALSKELIGFLGVLVVAASVLQQQFRPDARSSDARRRAARLRRLIRSVEDDLHELTSGDQGAPSIADMRRRVSAGLSAIEEAEVLDAEGEAVQGADA